VPESTTGNWKILPVWISVTASNSSSRAPKPPGKQMKALLYLMKMVLLRVSAIVDAHFSLIVNGETSSFRARRGGAQALEGNVAQSSTISLEPTAVKAAPRLVSGLSFSL